VRERGRAQKTPQIAAAIDNEERRQHEGLELIASENFVSEAVLEAACRMTMSSSRSCPVLLS